MIDHLKTAEELEECHSIIVSIQGSHDHFSNNTIKELERVQETIIGLADHHRDEDSKCTFQNHQKAMLLQAAEKALLKK